MKQYGGYDTKKQQTVFLLCWVAYFSTYICRLNYSAVMPELTSGHVFTGQQIAAVSSAFFICYGVGQLFSGILSDRLNPRWMVFFGVGGSALTNLLIFAFHQSYGALLALWAINGIAQAMVWAPILKIASLTYDSRGREKFGVDISTTVPLGTLASYAVSLLTLVFLPWKFVFLTCGILELGFAAIWIFGSKKSMSTEKAAEALMSAEAAAPAGEKVSVKAFLKMMAVSGVFLMLIPIAVQGTLKDSVTQWIPTFFKSEFESSTSFSLALTMILPIINVTGAYFAKAVNKKLKNELATSVVFFVISIGFLVLLRLFGTRSVVVALIAMAGVTNCMFALNVMLITMVPLAFQRSGRVGALGGFVNAMAYVGCGALNLLAGRILDNGADWNRLFIMWLILAVVALAATAVCVPLWKKFKKQEEA